MRNAMTMFVKTLAAVAGGTMFATGAFAHDATHSAGDVRGASPYVAIENEPAPKLIVDPPLAEGLAQDVSGPSTGWRICTSHQCLAPGRPGGISTCRASAHHR